MKISGLEKAALGLTAVVLLLTVGYFSGVRSGDTPYTVQGYTVRTFETGSGVELPSGPWVVNINTATVKQLQTLPGIGQKGAQAIVADRKINGPFRIPEDLMRVPGIGAGTVSEILDYITVE